MAVHLAGALVWNGIFNAPAPHCEGQVFAGQPCGRSIAHPLDSLREVLGAGVE